MYEHSGTTVDNQGNVLAFDYKAQVDAATAWPPPRVPRHSPVLSGARGVAVRTPRGFRRGAPLATAPASSKLNRMRCRHGQGTDRPNDQFALNGLRKVSDLGDVEL